MSAYEQESRGTRSQRCKRPRRDGQYKSGEGRVLKVALSTAWRGPWRAVWNEERVRPWMMRRSGLRRWRMESGMRGSNHWGKRVSETPKGKEVLAAASSIHDDR